jgi:hypothetical protein
MCNVPSIAVFCSESIECFPGTTPKFFLELLVTIPVAPIITGIIVHILLLLLLLLLLYSATNIKFIIAYYINLSDQILLSSAQGIIGP